MSVKRTKALFCVFTLLQAFVSCVYADAIDNPCGGEAALLNIIDRPTVADSACVVPYGKVVLESGYEYQRLQLKKSYQQNFPQAELRVGLPANNEFVLVLPNYIHQSINPYSGFYATSLGLKHEIGYNQHWLAAVEALFTLPDSAYAFGNRGLGVALNGIVSYTFNPKFNLSFMLGGTTGTESRASGGQRVTSINPDLVFTYSATQKVDLYGEIYGQSKTAPDQGSGFNGDGGIIFLITPAIAMDLEAGQHLSGSLGGFAHYVGVGLSTEF